MRTGEQQAAKDGAIAVQVDVTNNGSRAGDEMAQIYARHLGSKVERPRRQLVGFRRVALQPNETKTLEISVAASRLAYWDTKLQAFQVESGPVRLMADDSSASLPLNATVNIR